MWWPVLGLMAVVAAGEAARILAVLPVVTKSHYSTGGKLLRTLASRGHQVTMVSPFKETAPPDNWTWVKIDIQHFLQALPYAQKDLTLLENSFFEAQYRLWTSMNNYTEYITDLPELRNFIENDNSEFDLVIAEDFFCQAFYAFAHKYKAPLVILSTFGSAHYINEYTGNAIEFSTVPHEFRAFFGEMNFLERVKNLIYVLYDLVGRKYYSLEKQNEIAKRLFKLKDLPHVGELERNVSLVLINSHYSLSTVQPLLPNIIEMAGLHIEEPKPLTGELKSLLDSTPTGAILFSFGSFVKLDQLSPELVGEILRGLDAVGVTVLLKWDGGELPYKIKNIVTMKWMPQNDLLAHPNLKLFVTHGGLHSTEESIYHGVPVLCIPFFGDQFLNCQKAVSFGYGLTLTPQELTHTSLSAKLNELLTDHSFKNKATELAKRFKDRPSKPLDNAVFWIEYVLRHNGNDFLKGPKRNLYWYEIYYVDFLSILFLSIVILWIALKKVVDILFRRKSTSDEFVTIKSKKVKKN